MSKKHKKQEADIKQERIVEQWLLKKKAPAPEKTDDGNNGDY